MMASREVERPEVPGEAEPAPCPGSSKQNPHFTFECANMSNGMMLFVKKKRKKKETRPHSHIPAVHQSHLMPQFYIQSDRGRI